MRVSIMRTALRLLPQSRLQFSTTTEQFVSDLVSRIHSNAIHKDDAVKLLSDFVHKNSTLHKLQSETMEIDGIAKIDVNRAARNGFPEVIFGSGKTADHLARIMEQMYTSGIGGHTILATKVDAVQFERINAALGEGKSVYSPSTQMVYTVPKALADRKNVSPIEIGRLAPRVRGKVAVLCAGTSDFGVAEEAAVSLELSGVETVTRLYDVGVAGLHRLISRLDLVSDADVCIVAAGMDGALPSVLAGLVRCPVVAVPTSVGYGAAFGGVSALLSMLNSCSPGISIVNIDNGFGAAVVAFKILKTSAQNSSKRSES